MLILGHAPHAQPGTGASTAPTTVLRAAVAAVIVSQGHVCTVLMGTGVPIALNHVPWDAGGHAAPRTVHAIRARMATGATVA